MPEETEALRWGVIGVFKSQGKAMCLGEGVEVECVYRSWRGGREQGTSFADNR